MTSQKALEKIALGENLTCEFKRCGGNIENDVLETVCAFLNRWGGDIFLGVEDDGTILGVPANAAKDLIRNFNNCLNNDKLFNPTAVCAIEEIKIEDKVILHAYIGASSQVHAFKGKIYDRVDDSDFVVKGTDPIAQLYIRKQNIFTERRMFFNFKIEDFREDVFDKVRIRVQNRNKNHPWLEMTNLEILKNLGMYTKDAESDKTGFALASVLLFGTDEMIRYCLPAYRTDAICRKINVDRYDDRDIIETNLIDSVGRLMDFAQKHLNDKFYLAPDMQRISLSSNICREIIVNMLMHREFSSSLIPRFIIEKDKIITENANKAQMPDEITLENLSPLSKNPMIAKVFREIGFAEELGSGTRNLYKYVPIYSGSSARPQLMDGDIFRVTIPLDDELPAATEQVNPTSTLQVDPTSTEQVTEQVRRIVLCLGKKSLSVKEILDCLDLHHRPTLMSDYIRPAIDGKFVEMTQPDSPNSPTQKYRLTAKGLEYKKSME